MKDRVNYYIFLPATFLLFLLQTTFFAQALGEFFLPNFVLIFIFAAVLISNDADFIYAAFLFGFLFDLFSGNNFGVFLISFVLACVALLNLKEKFLKEQSFLKIVAISIAGTLLYNIIYIALLRIVFDTNLSSDYDFIRGKVAFDCIYTAIFIYPAMLLISK